MISKKSIEDVTQIAKVEEVVGDFVNLKRSGANLLGLCPFHHEKTPSFSVSPAKNIYKCFGCGKSGGPLQFVMDHDNLSYPEAIKYLAKKYNIHIEEIVDSKSDERYQDELKKEALNIVNEKAAQIYSTALYEHPQGKSIGLPYFKERGFLDNTIKAFQLGFAPDRKDYVVSQLIEKGFKIETIEEVGLLNHAKNDFLTNRVIFPIHNLVGKVIAFSGRKLGQNDNGPKYINSRETPLYQKSKVLYGMHLAKQAIRQKDECLLVEGYTDVISLHQAGIQNIVASSGTSLTQDQIRLIKRFTNNIKIVYDGDSAGLKATLRALDLILDEDMNVRMVILPSPDDPDSFVRKHGSSYVEKYISEKAIDFVLFKASLIKKEAQHDPIKKSEGITDIVHTIARIPDAIKRSTYIQTCASELDISEEVLINAVNKTVKKNYLDKKSKSGPDTSAPLTIESTGDTDPETKFSSSPQVRIVESDEYQERSLIRVLILYGHLLFDETHTVAEYINENLEELLEEFENPLYAQILKLYLHELSENNVINTDYFLNHPDSAIRSFAIELSHLPYTYSHNWTDRWEMELQTQKPPEENFVKDTYQSVLRFKLRKIQKMIKVNKKQLEEPDISEYDQLVLIRTQHELLQFRNEIADLLGIRVLG